MTQAVFPSSPNVGDQANGFEWDGQGWVRTGTGRTLPLAFVIPGKPPAGQHYYVPLPIAINIGTDLYGSVAYAGTAPTASAVFTVLDRVSSTVIGTVTFATNGSFSLSGIPEAFGAGAVLVLEAPDPQDDTLEDVGITILAARA
jgi:hypothetical protein